MKSDCNTKGEVLKSVNGEVSLYCAQTFAKCLAKFSTRHKSCPIDISLDTDISLYSDVNILRNILLLYFGKQIAEYIYLLWVCLKYQDTRVVLLIYRSRH